MNVKKIKECAGIVWRVISVNNHKWGYDELRAVTGLPNRYLNAAIGWLASENKIQFEGDEDERFYNELNFYIG